VRSPSETDRRGRWPRSLDEHTTNPSDVAPEWAQHMQGVTLTGDWWFITQEDGLWRLPVDADLADAGGESVRQVGIPDAGTEHLGDCDYWNGRVYVAMEGTSPARMGVFDTELEYIGSAAAGDQGSSNPWCAVDPLTALAVLVALRHRPPRRVRAVRRTRPGRPPAVAHRAVARRRRRRSRARTRAGRSVHTVGPALSHG
jgi:hypothetical protein